MEALRRKWAHCGHLGQDCGRMRRFCGCKWGFVAVNESDVAINGSTAAVYGCSSTENRTLLALYTTVPPRDEKDSTREQPGGWIKGISAGRSKGLARADQRD
eukprot:3306499-Rhodomonas_salina.1